MNGLKIKTRLLLVLIATLFSVPSFSQSDTGEAKQYPDHTLTPVAAPSQEIFYKGSLQAGGGVMYVIENKALRLSLGGDYEGHFSGNFVIAPHVYSGIEIEASQFGNTSFVAMASTL